MKQKNGGWIALFLAPACILFILIFAIPLVMVFVTSLFDYRLLPRTFTFVGFSNFVQLFTEDNRFWPIFGNSQVAFYPLHLPRDSWYATSLHPV